MKFLKNMKIGKKINVSFSIILIMIGFMLVVNIFCNTIILSSSGKVQSASDMNGMFNALNIDFSEARLWANAIYIQDGSTYPLNFDVEATNVFMNFENVLEYIRQNATLSDYEDKVADLQNNFNTWKKEVDDVQLYYSEANSAKNLLTSTGNAISEITEAMFRQQLVLLKDESTNQELLSNYAEVSKAFNSRSSKFSAMYSYTVDINNFRREVNGSMQHFKPDEVEPLAKKINTTLIAIKSFRTLYGDDDSILEANKTVELVETYKETYLLFAEVMERLSAHIETTRLDGEVLKGEVTALAKEMDELLARELNTVNTIVVVTIAVVAIVSVASIFIGVIVSKLLVHSITHPVTIMTNTLLSLGHDGRIVFPEEEIAIIEKVTKGKDEIADSVRALLFTMERLQDVGSVLETVSEGDLQVDVDLLSEHDVMGKSLHTMITKLNVIFKEIATSANEVASATYQIADGAQTLAQGSTQQAATMEELSASINVISQETKENDSRAEEAARLSKQILKDAAKGNSQMSEMLVAVNEITEASNNIGRVIKAIDDIAFQTNILALNAAVEAARAGEAGKGFAVVAEEVRNLATKSAAAAKETGGLIKNCIQKSELGAEIALNTAKSLEDIVDGIEHSADIIMQISESSRSQAASITEINAGIEQVSDVVQQNSATAEESAASSEEMSNQATYLKENVSQFRLKTNVSVYDEPDILI